MTPHPAEGEASQIRDGVQPWEPVSAAASDLGSIVNEGPTIDRVLIRHEGQCPRERSACGWRDRLISHEDAPLAPAAWAHAVDIDGAKPHFHKRSTELYYVLDGGGQVILDGIAHPVNKGSLVHIPPGVVHAAVGKMRVLVVGIPDIADDDYFPAP